MRCLKRYIAALDRFPVTPAALSLTIALISDQLAEAADIFARAIVPAG